MSIGHWIGNPEALPEKGAVEPVSKDEPGRAEPAHRKRRQERDRGVGAMVSGGDTHPDASGSVDPTLIVRPTGPLVRKAHGCSPPSRLICARPRQIRRAALADLTPKGAACRTATVCWSPSLPGETPFEPPSGSSATPAARRLGSANGAPTSPGALH